MVLYLLFTDEIDVLQVFAPCSETPLLADTGQTITVQQETVGATTRVVELSTKVWGH